MSTGLKQGSSGETPGWSIIGRGRFTFIKGTWYCDCDRAARCLTTKKTGANQQELPALRIPTQNVIRCDNLQHSTTSDVSGRDSLALSPDTPSTKAKRKQVAVDIAEHLGDDDLYNRNVDGSERSSQTIVAQGILPRKAAKASILSTPGQRFTEKLKSRMESLPTPDSREHRAASCNKDSEQRLFQLLDTSPTPGRFRDAARPGFDAESDLTTTILKLIRSDNLELKASTEIQLRHEIDLQLDLGTAKEQRHKDTITRLCTRVDELETMVLQLTE